MKSIKFAIAALIVAAGAGSAQAMPVAKGIAAQPHASGITQVRHMGHPHVGGPRFHGYHHHHFRPYGFGPRITVYRGGGCYWLKERALSSGSRYWWRRYQACRNGW